MLNSHSRSITKHQNADQGLAAAPGRAHPKNGSRTIEHDSQHSSSDLCFIRLKEVLSICGKSRSSVYASIKKGDFPAPIKVGGRSSAWVKSEVLQWARRCIACSRIK